MIARDAHPLRGPLSTAARLAAFLAWTLAIAAAWLPAAPVLGRRRRVTWAGRLTRAYGAGLLRILGVRLRVHGPLPEGPFYLVTNHCGYLDVMAISSVLPCAFVAKAEVAAWPLFGPMASWSGTLFIDRKSPADVLRINGLIAGRIADGGSLAIFPEGTSTDGTAVDPFHSSLLQGPAAGAAPVHYAALRYRAPAGGVPARFSMCWWGDMEFLPHFLSLFRMRGMEASISFGRLPMADRDRKALALKLQRGVEERLSYLDGVERGFPVRPAPATVPAAKPDAKIANKTGGKQAAPKPKGLQETRG